MLPDQYKSSLAPCCSLLFRNLGQVMPSWVEISILCLVKMLEQPVLQVIQQVE